MAIIHIKGGLCPGSVLSHEMYGLVIVAGVGQEFLDNILSFDLKTGCANARVAADVLSCQNIFIDKEFYVMALIIHKSHDAY